MACRCCMAVAQWVAPSFVDLHYTKKVKDISKCSRYFVQFHELALILVFKSRYWQISLIFCVVYIFGKWVGLIASSVCSLVKYLISNMHCFKFTWIQKVFPSWEPAATVEIHRRLLADCGRGLVIDFSPPWRSDKDRTSTRTWRHARYAHDVVAARRYRQFLYPSL